MLSLENAALRVQQGDFQAFEAIVRQTSARLVRVAARVIGDLAEAEDVPPFDLVAPYCHQSGY